MDKKARETEKQHIAMVGRRLRAFVTARDLQQVDIANVTGLDPSSLSKILQGEKALKPVHANIIQDVFGCTLEFLYRGEMGRMDPALSSRIISILNE